MKYCNNCVLPDTRPGIEIEPDGMCNACHRHREKSYDIDWKQREKDFEKLVDEVKAVKAPFDCVVPVSGGKDSTAQVVKCLEYGLKVLAITWRTPGRTAIGQKNLDNLIRLGADHIDYSVNPEVERKFTYAALKKTGSTAVPMHLGLYIIPLRFAVLFKVPLVMWGESPAMEYGGKKDEHLAQNLDHRFLKSHGILQGTLMEDWISEDLTERDLEIYRMPEEKEFRDAGVKSIFMGYFFKWSPQESLRVACEHGFSVRAEGPKVGYYNYADIDCDFISVHHYFKWLKFGFSRLFDNLSLEIRNGIMTRAEAIEIIRATGPQVPTEDIDRLCKFLQISQGHFWEIAESFRNRDVWRRKNGKWVIDDFLIPDWKFGDN